MNTPGFLDIKNSANRAYWAWRWHLQGGSSGWAARPLQDLRNDDDLKRYREIELQRRHLRPRARVVNLAHVRFERIRRKAKRAI